MDFEAYLTALRGKTVSVIGIGVSNRPLIEKLLEKGVAVTARDKKESLGELGAELAAAGCAGAGRRRGKGQRHHLGNGGVF